MKKVLIITYYWPPAGGPGVQRWLKFVKYLRDFQIEPVVYIPENPGYPIIDGSLQDEVPEGIKILRQPIREPYKLAGIFSKKETEKISSGIIAEEKKQSFLEKMMLFIRGNFFIPDARVLWVKPSVKYLSAFLKEEKIETLITTGPPHSLHLIGLNLKKHFNVKWIADFRDPWTQIGYHEKLKLTRSSREKHENLEKEVLQTADKIIATSFSTREEFQQKTSKEICLITNGFDIEENNRPYSNDKFIISHVGSLLSGRNPINLWKALSELIKENPKFEKDLQLSFAGRISEEVVSSMKDFGLSSFLELKGYVGHGKAVKLQRESALLLLLEIDSEITRGIIPGKLFEYLASKRPILAIGPHNWDVGKILSDAGAGQVFQYGDKETIKNFIFSEYQKFKNGEELLLASEVSKYHRRETTKKLAELIKNL
ncbi:glycosyl transferase family 1 [Christiangramia fulva]|uniref:Glycosyl transferase family 1 n=1 Tax=Christiangramia fulva TaxID=2126553 RepID=A0A2R3ZB04_9FLAO|nr:glycosyltransferase family 4 protein [Christiangramia fulva]AVR47473.1 glycosyl transferase family 1 [Christiangramia fulva]